MKGKAMKNNNMIVTAIVVFATFASAWAANVTWNNSTGNGQWSDPDNWAGGAPIPTTGPEAHCPAKGMWLSSVRM